MSDYRINRMQPRFLLQKGIGNLTPASGRLFKDLAFAMMPVRASLDALAPSGRDVIGPVSSDQSSNNAGVYAEANGRALRFPSWANFSIPRPVNSNAAFTVLCFYVPRDLVDGGVLVNYGGGSGGGATGWGLLHSGTSGVISMLSWGIAGWSSGVHLGAVNTPHVAGFAFDGAGNVRFFVNGRFTSVGSVSTPRAYTGIVKLGRRADNVNNPFTGSIHAAYIWNRAITDGEFMTVFRDPWVIVRPRQPWLLGAAAVPPASSRAPQLFSFIGS